MKKNLEEYIILFKQLNEEEKKIKEGKDNNSRLEEFYKRKNEIALAFIKDINNEDIVDDKGETISLYDLIEYEHNYQLYYDHIKVNFNEDESFTILPPVVCETEEGAKELYEFMVKAQVSPWCELEMCNSYAWIEELTERMQEEFWGPIYPKNEETKDYFAEVIQNKIEEAKERAEKFIQTDMQKYDLTYEEAMYMENIFDFEDPDFLATVVKRYGVEALQAEPNTTNKFLSLGETIARISHEETETLGTEISESDLDNFIIENIGLEDTNGTYVHLFIGSVKLSDEIIQEIIEGDNYDNIIALSENQHLTDSHIKMILNKSIAEGKSEILEKVFSYHQIKSILFEHDQEYEDWEKARLIKNNQNLSSELMIELVQHGWLNIFFDSLSKESDITYPQEVCEYVLEHASTYGKEKIVQAIIAGKISITDESLRKLALDRNIDEKYRMILINMPEYEERIPKIDDSEKLDIRHRYNRYGIRTGGPGDFDNMGGALDFYVNGINIFSDDAQASSYGKTQEERKWARNAYTDFSKCIEPEEFKSFCDVHKKAILILTQNNEFFKSFNNLRDRVLYIESALQKQQQIGNKEGHHKYNSEEVAEAVDGVTLDEHQATVLETRDAVENLPVRDEHQPIHNDEDGQNL